MPEHWKPNEPSLSKSLTLADQPTLLDLPSVLTPVSGIDSLEKIWPPVSAASESAARTVVEKRWVAVPKARPLGSPSWNVNRKSSDPSLVLFATASPGVMPVSPSGASRSLSPYRTVPDVDELNGVKLPSSNVLLKITVARADPAIASVTAIIDAALFRSLSSRGVKTFPPLWFCVAL